MGVECFVAWPVGQTPSDPRSNLGSSVSCSEGLCRRLAWPGALSTCMRVLHRLAGMGVRSLFGADIEATPRPVSYRLLPGVMVLPTAAALSCDGKPLSTLAKKVPQHKRCADHNADDIGKRQRDALVWILDRLSKRPQEIIPLQSYMITRDLSAVATAAGPSDWSPPYKALERLPKPFMTKLLVELALEGTMEKHFNKSVATKLEVSDSMNIPTLFSLVLQLPLSCTLPEEFADESICMMTLKKRASDVGKRLKTFIDAGGLGSNSLLDIRGGGAFKFHFDEQGKALFVEHCLGEKVAVPSHILVTPSFAIHDNHLDFKSTAKLHPQSIPLHSFFTASGSSNDFLKHMYQPGKKFRSLHDDANNFERQQQAMTKGGVSEAVAADATEAMRDAAKERNAAQMVKARQALTDRKRKRDESRVIQLS